jgi:hypothetical protein
MYRDREIEREIERSRERENESYINRLCVDLKRGAMERAPWCKSQTVPLPGFLNIPSYAP